MDLNSFTLSEDAFNAHVLGDVMDASSQPGESGAEARTRCAAIVEVFRTFAPVNAMESTTACHCISLRLMLNAAIRDAGNVNQEPAMLIRLRASAMALSKTLHLWLAKYESMHARNEARAAEALQRACQLEAAGAPLKPKPDQTQPPVAPPHRSGVMAAQSPEVSARLAVAAPPAPAMLPTPAPTDPGMPREPGMPTDPGMKIALPFPAAASQAAQANGRQIVPAPTAVT